jgi:hypothetical protein
MSIGGRGVVEHLVRSAPRATWLVIFAAALVIAALTALCVRESDPEAGILVGTCDRWPTGCEDNPRVSS